MDESTHTYPAPVEGFSDAEKKRWNRNLKKLQKKVDRKLNPRKRKAPCEKQDG